MVDSQTIPAWFVSILMILTGFMWIVARRVNIKIDFRSFAFTYVIEGMIYGTIFQLFDIDTEIRGFFVRLMIVILCLSQYLPLFVSYLRSKYNDKSL